MKIFKNEKNVLKSSIELTCIALAIKAMSHAYPSEKVIAAYFLKPGRLQSELLSIITWCMDTLKCDDEAFMSTIREKRERYREMAQKLLFDEYYWVTVKIKKEQGEGVNYCLMAIEKEMKEVFVNKGYDERLEFLYSLGPEYEKALRYGIDTYNGITNMGKE